MRALYQHMKGRDLYDLFNALQSGTTDNDRIVACFQHYLARDGLTVSRAQFEANLAAKLESDAFLEDIRPLIPADASYDPIAAAEFVCKELVLKLPGEPWKGAGP